MSGIEEIRLEKWEDFEKETRELLEGSYGNQTFLFRGQANAEWKLESTLDRLGVIRWNDYLASIKKVNKHLGSCLNKYHNIDDEIEGLLKNGNFENLSSELQAYLVYLRQNGFPSPLLDWSRSPYIASFFAFCEPYNKAKEVAIYFYIKNENLCSVNMSIFNISNDIKTDKKHFLQQSEYTFCVSKEKSFIDFSHKSLIKHNNNHSNYVILRRYILPASEDRKVMALLDSMNINHYSLFQNEQSLLQALAMKTIYFDLYFIENYFKTFKIFKK